ncbi:CLUMA_CG006055, isoform A [Clunio marinus]|uniref:CLUMA_CG006055, isoform A n=1 Tax=Clunio marinus TaxID=568069 RepID=A0A1J1I2A3_9DIPT|nr:CLUMA_CG006055, isoform A [Clunio marinus]
MFSVKNNHIIQENFQKLSLPEKILRVWKGWEYISQAQRHTKNIFFVSTRCMLFVHERIVDHDDDAKKGKNLGGSFDIVKVLTEEKKNLSCFMYRLYSFVIDFEINL